MLTPNSQKSALRKETTSIQGLSSGHSRLSIVIEDESGEKRILKGRRSNQTEEIRFVPKPAPVKNPQSHQTDTNPESSLGETEFKRLIYFKIITSAGM